MLAKSGGGGGGGGGGGVVYEEFTEAKRSSGGTSMSINSPAGTTDGDLLIAALATDGMNETGMTISGGGWTKINQGHTSEAVTMAVWSKLASSEPATYTFGWETSQEAYGWIMRFTGHDPVSPINDTAASGGSSSAPTSPAVTTTVDNAMILRIGGFDDDDITVDSPGLSGHTAITMDESGTGNSTSSGGAGYVIQPTAGSSGTSTFSLTGSEQYRAVTIGIAPAP
jgi:hypothetical protein